jgi:glycosyltransferase involved in cell wall biosynthesis
VHDGETGILFEPEDAGGLAQALRRLAGEPAEARRLGAEARREYDRNLTPRATVDRLLEIYAPARAGRAAGVAVPTGAPE